MLRLIGTNITQKQTNTQGSKVMFDPGGRSVQELCEHRYGNALRLILRFSCISPKPIQPLHQNVPYSSLSHPPKPPPYQAPVPPHPKSQEKYIDFPPDM